MKSKGPRPFCPGKKTITSGTRRVDGDDNCAKFTVRKRGDVVARLVREDCAGNHYSVCLGYEDEVSGVWLPCSTRENAKKLLKAIKKYAMD